MKLVTTNKNQYNRKQTSPIKIGLVLLLFILQHIPNGYSQVSPYQTMDPILNKIFTGTDGSWAKSVLDTMSLETKLGQLFMIQAYTNSRQYNASDIKKLITKYRLGGILFMQGTAEKQVQLTNEFQELSSLPLMIAQDAEWGLNMRIENTLKFPMKFQTIL